MTSPYGPKPQLRFYSRSRPSLYRYAIERQYDQIPNHINNSKEFRIDDIYWVDQYKCNVLHILTSPRYVDDELLQAVRSILEVDTDDSRRRLVRQTNDAGYIPLHLALQKRVLHTRLERRILDGFQVGIGGRVVDTMTLNSIRNNLQLVFLLINTCPETVSIPMSQPSITGYAGGGSGSRSSRNKYKTSLDICCEMNVHIDIFRAILSIDPKLVVGETTQNQSNKYTQTNNQLQTLWSAGTKTSGTTRTRTTSNSSSSNNNNNASSIIMNDLENKMELLLKAIYCGSIIESNPPNGDEDDGGNNGNHGSSEKNEEHEDHEDKLLHQHPTSSSASSSSATTTLTPASARTTSTPVFPFHFIHAVCSTQCPSEYISRILEKEECRAQVSIPDEKSNYLPLHYACQSAKVDSQPYTEYLIDELLNIYPQAAKIPYPTTSAISNEEKIKDTNTNNNDGYVDRRKKCSNDDYDDDDAPSLIREKSPSSNLSQRTQPQVLPLHVLITDCQMTWHNGGIKSLVYAYPDSVRKVDPRNGLVPFQSSAIHAIQSKLHLSTTYELLLSAPEMIVVSA